MTTNKPEVVAWYYKHATREHLKRLMYRPMHKVGENYEEIELIRLSDYETLQAECEKLRKDAERYRWLRRHATLDGGSDYHFPEVHAWEYKEGAQSNEQYGSLDCAIDAAMQEHQP